MDPARARSELAELARRAPDPFPLDRAALLLAADEYPRLEPDACEQRLDGYAARVAAAARSGPDADPRIPLGALRRVLFEEEGFQGNRRAYYDVRNSYLNEVLGRRLGIPISLATLVFGVARRLGWPLRVVSFPAHVLVCWQGGCEPVAADPFHGGLILAPEEVGERWRTATGQEPPSLRRMLAACEPRGLLLRMLNNIRCTHLNEGRFALAALAVEKMALVEPENADYERVLGYYRLAARDLDRAVEHLERYLERAPETPGSAGVRRDLLGLRRRQAPGA